MCSKISNLQSSMFTMNDHYLVDYSVMRAIDALIGLYRAESRGHTPKAISLDKDEAELLDRVKIFCEWRMGRRKLSDDPIMELDQFTKLDDMLSCLRRIRRSVEKRNARGGPKDISVLCPNI